MPTTLPPRPPLPRPPLHIRPEVPPRPYDAVLVAVLAPMAVVEVLARDDGVWPWWSWVLVLVVVAAVLWRTRYPLVALVVAYGARTLAGVVPVLTGRDHGVLHTNAVIFLLVCSPSRWALGRHVVIGGALLLVGHVTREALYGTAHREVAVGAAVLLLPLVLGPAVRWWTLARSRQRERERERERQARELHDTVAHHVSGIVITAQAGRTLAARDPGEAVASLRVAGQRARPGRDALRRGGAARRRGGWAAQEAVTHARWHAIGASRVDVRVTADDGTVRVEVDDDGSGRTGPRGRGGGLGLVGMRERVQLLDGRLDVGPRPGSGWMIVATLPARRAR